MFMLMTQGKLTSQLQDNLGTDHLDLRFLSWLAHQFNRQNHRTVHENTTTKLPVSIQYMSEISVT